jgi:hypothetical protein
MGLLSMSRDTLRCMSPGTRPIVFVGTPIPDHYVPNLASRL